jgi:hypothetical protein
MVLLAQLHLCPVCTSSFVLGNLVEIAFVPTFGQLDLDTSSISYYELRTLGLLGHSCTVL